jgi:phosphopantothenoylcysteine decarboxylase/phosphopantothenate--cysteine ligase
VTLVAANVALQAPAGAHLLSVRTAAELEQACDREFPACDVLLMAAAVADFRPADPAAEKLKKGGRETLELVLEPTPDVLAGLSAQRHPGQTLVGFAAEHGNGAVEIAREKLSRKGLDALVVNDISRGDIGFESDENEVTILSAREDGAVAQQHIARTSKTAVAEAVLDAVEGLRSHG